MSFWFLFKSFLQAIFSLQSVYFNNIVLGRVFTIFFYFWVYCGPLFIHNIIYSCLPSSLDHNSQDSSIFWDLYFYVFQLWILRPPSSDLWVSTTRSFCLVSRSLSLAWEPGVLRSPQPHFVLEFWFPLLVFKALLPTTVVSCPTYPPNVLLHWGEELDGVWLNMAKSSVHPSSGPLSQSYLNQKTYTQGGKKKTKNKFLSPRCCVLSLPGSSAPQPLALPLSPDSVRRHHRPDQGSAPSLSSLSSHSGLAAPAPSALKLTITFAASLLPSEPVVSSRGMSQWEREKPGPGRMWKMDRHWKWRPGKSSKWRRKVWSLTAFYPDCQLPFGKSNSAQICT